MGALVMLIIDAMNIKVNKNMKVKPKLVLLGYIIYADTKNPIMAMSIKLPLRYTECQVLGTDEREILCFVVLFDLFLAILSPLLLSKDICLVFKGLGVIGG